MAPQSPNIFDRIPPQSIEAEQSTLGAALISNKALHRVLANGDRGDFYHESHRKIWDALVELARKELPADLLTAPEELKRLGTLEAVGGIAYLNTLADAVPTAAHVEHYQDVAIEKRGLRDLIEVCNEISAAAYAQQDPPDKLIQQLVRRLVAMDRKRGLNVRDLRTVALDQVQRIQAGEGHPALYTGIDSLDNLAGGICDGDVAIICGLPGGGKSAVGLQFAEESASTWGPTLIVSLEMGADSIAMRAMSAMAGLTYRQLRDAGTYNPGTRQVTPFKAEEVERIGEAAKRLLRLPHPLLVDEDAHQLDALVHRCHSYVLEHGVRCIIVDYGQLIAAPNVGAQGRTEELRYVARALKTQVANPLKVPVYVMAQANRDVHKRGQTLRKDTDPSQITGLLQMSDLGGTSEWEAVAAQIHFINRDPRHPKPQPGETESRVPILWGCAKNRNGQMGFLLPMIFDKPAFRFVTEDNRHDDTEAPRYVSAGYAEEPEEYDTLFGGEE